MPIWGERAASRPGVAADGRNRILGRAVRRGGRRRPARPAAASDSITAGNTTPAESATVVQFDGWTGPGMIFLVNDTNVGPSGSSHPAALGGWAGGSTATWHQIA